MQFEGKNRLTALTTTDPTTPVIACASRRARYDRMFGGLNIYARYSYGASAHTQLLINDFSPSAAGRWSLYRVTSSCLAMLKC